MRWLSRFGVVAALLCVCSAGEIVAQDPEGAKKPAAEAGKRPAAFVKPLTKEQQEKLLNRRLDGRMGDSFGQFSNMFLALSRIKLGVGVGLMTSSPEISKAGLLVQNPG